MKTQYLRCSLTRNRAHLSNKPPTVSDRRRVMDNLLDVFRISDSGIHFLNPSALLDPLEWHRISSMDDDLKLLRRKGDKFEEPRVRELLEHQRKFS